MTARFIIAIALLALSACGHRELKAPCTASYDLFGSTAYANSVADDCGPMFPVNQNEFDISGELSWNS
uniref:Lipoprotein n=1 Tax=Ochrobactrum sp. LM19 TaxID=1449781 RepID=A0A0D5A1C5_9HYPH|nr:hypothetical protein [Ochrobactrum sp. LM19]AJW30003.1 hypothetical protein pLM19O2_p58 [Ochrobactrum sp. LM19]